MGRDGAWAEARTPGGSLRAGVDVARPPDPLCRPAVPRPAHPNGRGRTARTPGGSLRRRDGRRSASGTLSAAPRSHAQRIRTGVGGQRGRPEDLFARRWTSLRMAPLGCPPVPRQAHPRRRPVVFAFPSRMKPAAVPLDDPNERCARSTREVRERGRVRWSHSSPRTNDVPQSARRWGIVVGCDGPTRRPERTMCPGPPGDAGAWPGAVVPLVAPNEVHGPPGDAGAWPGAVVPVDAPNERSARSARRCRGVAGRSVEV